MTNWLHRSPPAPLGDEAHVWLIRLDGGSGPGRDLARDALREIAGAYLEIPAATVEFETDPGGKPRLSGDPLMLSLSHSGDLALVALSASSRVGVDLERIREVRAERIASRFFSEAERAALAEAPERDRPDLFFASWTRKEAVLKATGEGIAGGLAGCEVPIAPAGASHRAELGTVERDGSLWTLFDLDPAPGYRAAIAVEARDGRPPSAPFTFGYPRTG